MVGLSYKNCSSFEQNTVRSLPEAFSTCTNYTRKSCDRESIRRWRQKYVTCFDPERKVSVQPTLCDLPLVIKCGLL